MGIRRSGGQEIRMGLVGRGADSFEVLVFSFELVRVCQGRGVLVGLLVLRPWSG